MARFPRLQPNDDLVARDRRARRRRQRPRLDVDVVDHARVVGDDVGKIARLLEGADDRGMGALEDADDAALGPVVAGARAGEGGVARDPGDDAVAVHGGAGVFRRDEDVAFGVIFPDQKAEAALVNLEFPGDEVSLGGEDVAILANARDLAVALEMAERFLEQAAMVALHPEGAAKLDFIERPIFRPAHEGEDSGLEVAVFFHARCPRASGLGRGMERESFLGEL